MAKIDPKQYKEEYGKQEELTAGYTTPPAGTYEVVNVQMNRLIIRTKEDKIMHMVNIHAHILKCVESHDKNGAANGKEFEGKKANFSLFADFTRPDGTPDRKSIAMMSSLGLACGQTEAWDPEVDGELVKATTGVPYLLKFDIRERTIDNGEVRKDISPRDFHHLSPDAKKKHMSAPDWKKIVGEADKRMTETKDFSDKAGKKEGAKPAKKETANSAPQEDDPFHEMT